MRDTEFGVAHLPTLLSSVISGTRKARREEKRQTRPAPAWGISSGFLGPLLGLFLDFDFLRLGFGRLRNGDLQNSVRHGCLHAGRIDASRQLQPAQEHAIASLAELDVLVLLGFLDLLLAADGEGVILDRYLDVLALEPRHLRADLNRSVAFGDLDAGDDVRRRAVRAYPLRKVAEQPVDLPVQAEQSEIRSHQA